MIAALAGRVTITAIVMVALSHQATHNYFRYTEIAYIQIYTTGEVHVPLAVFLFC